MELCTLPCEGRGSWFDSKWRCSNLELAKLPHQMSTDSFDPYPIGEVCQLYGRLGKLANPLVLHTRDSRFESEAAYF